MLIDRADEDARELALRSAAFVYATRGWRPVPLRGKVRVPSGGYNNVGILTGDGLVVIDVDLPFGPESLRALEEEHGPLPRTPTVRSGSGGRHYYFATDREIRSRKGLLGREIDLLGEPGPSPFGYVVAPPSVHASGAPYEWIVPPSVELAPLPDWVPERLDRVAERNSEIRRAARHALRGAPRLRAHVDRTVVMQQHVDLVRVKLRRQ